MKQFIIASNNQVYKVEAHNLSRACESIRKHIYTKCVLMEVFVDYNPKDFNYTKIDNDIISDALVIVDLGINDKIGIVNFRIDERYSN